MAIRLLVACAILLAAVPSAAQPNAWVARTVIASFQRIGFLDVFDLGVNRDVMSLRLPEGIVPGDGAITPDGRYFLLPMSIGIGRFAVGTRQFEGMFGPQGPAGTLWMSPSGRWVHVLGPEGRYRVLDATGTIVREECCTAPDTSTLLAFSAGSGVRVVSRRSPAESRVTAYPEDPDAAALWSVTLPGAPPIGYLHADNAFVTTTVHPASGPEIVLLDAATGTEVRRRTLAQLMEGIPIPAPYFPHLTGLDQHGGTLVASTDSLLRHDLLLIDLATLTRLGNVERAPALGGRTEARAVKLSADGSTAYWTYFVSLLGITVSYTAYDIVDLFTRRLLAGGSLGSQYAGRLALETTAPCVIDVPAVLALPPAEGSVNLPITPSAACPSSPWGAEGADFVRVLDRGPHVGATTLRLAWVANLFSWPAPRTTSITVAGHRVAVHQRAETSTPGAPVATAMVRDGRVVVNWVPGAGPVPTAFTLRGGIRGQPFSAVVTLAPEARVWTSPVLSAGSYAVELTAGNVAGESPPSNRIELSVGEIALAQPPVLAAAVTDDTVRLSWLAAASGPAPESFVIEAAPAGTTTFAPVLRAGGQSLFLPGAPIGHWQARVRAVTAGGVGAPSNEVSFVTARCASAPSPPTGLTSVTLGRLVTLHWTAPTGAGPPAYVVEVGSNAGLSDYGRIALSGADRFLQTEAPDGVFHVRVRAQNACGGSTASNEIVVWSR